MACLFLFPLLFFLNFLLSTFSFSSSWCSSFSIFFLISLFFLLSSMSSFFFRLFFFLLLHFLLLFFLFLLLFHSKRLFLLSVAAPHQGHGGALVESIAFNRRV